MEDWQRAERRDSPLAEALRQGARELAESRVDATPVSVEPPDATPTEIS
jgi:hypothetical protein